MFRQVRSPVANQLPAEYRAADPDSLKRRIAQRKRELGPELRILCHHYQRRELVPFADDLGDSFALSKAAAEWAANEPQAKYIAFCGVHFMAESADILTGGRLKVHLPNPFAGCPMADMAPGYQVLAAWEEIAQVVPADSVIPISYMNSTAALKGFCGARRGLTCTSSNAHKAMAYAFERGDRVFFFPDQHLGRNTANRLGIDRDRVILFDPEQPLGGNSPEVLEKSKVILWKGHCHVHKNFEPGHIHRFREKYPTGKVVVHPECAEETVALADAVGSTSFIVNYVRDAAPGSVIAIGTELNLIDRLAHEYPDRTVLELTGQDCPLCVNMFRTTLADLAYTLDHVGEVNRVTVDADTRVHALAALERMISLPPS